MRDSTDFKNILKVYGAYCLVEDGTLTAVSNFAALKASPALLLRMICRLVLAAPQRVFRPRFFCGTLTACAALHIRTHLTHGCTLPASPTLHALSTLPASLL